MSSYSERLAGVDIGGTKIRWVILRGSWLLASGELRTPPGREAFIREFRKLCGMLRARGVSRLGIGAAGTVRGNTLVSGVNLPSLRNLDFKAMVPKGMYIRLDNDARAFARGEAAFLPIRSTVLCLTLGTGVGRALVRDGTVLAVRRFEPPEKWEKEYQRRKKDPSSGFAEFMAARLGGLAEEFRPDIIVLGGGELRKRGLFRRIRRGLRARLGIPVRRSRFRQNGAARGAALLGRMR